MINGFQGIPGSGKSYEASVFHVLPAIRAGRKVITNLPINLDQLKVLCPDTWQLLEIRTQAAPVRGVWDASNLAAAPAYQLFEDGRLELPASQSPFSSVWCFWSEWKGEDGVGPLYVIDECQISFPRIGTPKSVQEWFQLHRHYNADVLLLSQQFRQVDAVLSGLLANLIICRKADLLGDSDGYIRKVKGGYRGDVIQTERRKYEKQYFSLYRSHTQSSASTEATATDVTPKYAKLKRLTAVYWVFAICFCVWAFWPKDDAPKQAKAPPKSVAQPQVAASAPTAAASRPAAPPAVVASAAVKEPDKFGVLDGKAVHIVGSLTMGGKTAVVFEVSEGGRRLFQIDRPTLERSGYTLKITGDCLVELRSPSGKARAVTCDAPMLATRDSRQPLVIDRTSGASSWDRGEERPFQAAVRSGTL